MASQDKKTRSDNFTPDEVSAICEEVGSLSGVLFGKLGNTLTKADKERIWSQVTDVVNARGCMGRSIDAVKKKAGKLRSGAKEKASNNAREYKKTGGGTADEIPLTENENKILESVPGVMISGIDGGIDTSSETPLSDRAVWKDDYFVVNPCHIPRNSAEEVEVVLSVSPAAVNVTSETSRQVAGPSGAGEPFTVTPKDNTTMRNPKRRRIDEATSIETMQKEQLGIMKDQLLVMRSIETRMSERNAIELEKNEILKKILEKSDLNLFSLR